MPINWTVSELERQALVLRGLAVVANKREGQDEALRAWAKENDLLVEVCRPALWEKRPDIWGNPFKVASFATGAQRDEACARFADYLQGRPDLLARLWKLKGKVLACWCHPDRCHGDHLAELANAHHQQN